MTLGEDRRRRLWLAAKEADRTLGAPWQNEYPLSLDDVLVELTSAEVLEGLLKINFLAYISELRLIVAEIENNI